MTFATQIINAGPIVRIQLAPHRYDSNASTALLNCVRQLSIPANLGKNSVLKSEDNGQKNITFLHYVSIFGFIIPATVLSAHSGERGSTGYDCQSFSWSVEQGK